MRIISKAASSNLPANCFHSHRFSHVIRNEWRPISINRLRTKAAMAVVPTHASGDYQLTTFEYT